MAQNPHTILILVILVWEILWAPKCHNKSIIGIKFYPCNLHFGLGGIRCAPPSAIIIYKTHTNKRTFIYEEKLLFLNNSKILMLVHSTTPIQRRRSQQQLGSIVVTCGSEQVVLFAHVQFFINSKKLRVQGLRFKGFVQPRQGNISLCLVHKHVYQVNFRQIFAPLPSPKGCFEHLQVTNHAQFLGKEKTLQPIWEAQSNESSSSSMFTPKP